MGTEIMMWAGWTVYMLAENADKRIFGLIVFVFGAVMTVIRIFRP